MSSATVVHSSVTGWSVELGLTPLGVRQFNGLAARLAPKSPPENSIALVVDGHVMDAVELGRGTFDHQTIEITDLGEPTAEWLAASLTF